MNERIKELRKQVKIDVDPHGQSDDVQDLVAYLTKDDRNKVLNAYLEKFAELIVKDCLDIVKNTPRHCARTTYDLDTVECTIEDSIKAIKDHFGV